MVFDKVFDRFIDDSAASVMLRGALENVLSAKRLDELFSKHAMRQVVGELLFSTCADVMSSVVCAIQPSVNAAYRCQNRKERISVSVQSVYNKLAGIEPQVSEALVRETAIDLAVIRSRIGELKKGPLPGYAVRIVDGNHLAGTEHRLQELRSLGAAALPGHTMPILNPHTELIEDILVCEDGHANQRTMHDQLLGKVDSRQCWIGDSHFCTKKTLFGIKRKRAYFLIRQHSSLQGELLGRRRKLGRVSTGVLYEQQMSIGQDDQTMVVRRLTIVRNKPTKKGNKEVHLVTNLPQKVSGAKAANAYLSRWTIESAFCKLATTLRSEINTLGYPDAALFGFCVGVVLYNTLAVVIASLEAAHPLPKVEDDDEDVVKSPRYSYYYLADELSGVWRGMEIAIPSEAWKKAFADLTPIQLANKLLWLAKHVDPKQFHTNPYRTKKSKRSKTKSGNRGNHVSTHREIEKRINPERPKMTA